MPRINTATWSNGDPLTADRLNDINQDLDDLYAKWDDRLKVYPNSGLNITIGAGSYRVGNLDWLYAGGTATLSDNATSYVMIDNIWSIVINTTGWIPENAKIAIVTTLSGAITNIQQWRYDVFGGEVGLSFGSDIIRPGIWNGPWVSTTTNGSSSSSNVNVIYFVPFYPYANATINTGYWSRVAAGNIIVWVYDAGVNLLPNDLITSTGVVTAGGGTFAESMGSVTLISGRLYFAAMAVSAGTFTTWNTANSRPFNSTGLNQFSASFTLPIAGGWTSLPSNVNSGSFGTVTVTPIIGIW